MANDSRQYYKLLKVEPGVSVEEVKLAYGFLKYEWEAGKSPPDPSVQEAYRCLSDPKRKAAYDAKSGGSLQATRLKNTVLFALLVILLLFAGFVFPGFLRPPPEPFNAGDRLSRVSTAEVLGEVVRRESLHTFPNGQVVPGYLIRLPDSTERWYPASDLESHYRRQ